MDNYSTATTIFSMPSWRWTSAIRRFGMVLTAFAMLFATSVSAHPHNWIDVFAEWQFNQQGLITGVEMRLLLDDYYSVMLLNDIKTTGENLDSVLTLILGKARDNHYYLNIEQKGRKPRLGAAKNGRIKLRGNRIEIAFQLPLRTPLDPRSEDVIYRVAEPTYYFEMLHAEKGPAIVLKGAPRSCRYSLEEPRPNAALIAYAASLGVNETGGNDLGIQFAEKVTIRCE